MWITKDIKKDLLFLILPGFLTLLFLKIVDTSSLIFSIGLIILLTIDSSHIYSTFWRTIFNKTERNRSRWMYLYSPILIFVIFFILFLLKFPYFWNFIIYLTVYHQIKQGIGIYKWYQKNNQNYSQTPVILYYLITLFSFMAFHFRNPPIQINFYSSSDLFLYPNNELYLFSISLLIISLLYFIINEITNLYNNTSHLNTFLHSLFFLGVQTYCFLFGENMFEVILPQLIYHAVSYQASVSIAITKTNNFWKSKILLFLILSLLIGFSANRIEEFLDVSVSGEIINSFLLALYMIPTLCHHFWDAFIWKKSHPEWHKVFFDVDH